MSGRSSSFKIVIRSVERPFHNDVDENLEFICRSLGFFEPIDKDKTARAVFKELVTRNEQGEAPTSSELARHVKMSRGAVINHLNRMVRSGLIVRQGRTYFIRSKSMLRTVNEIEEDIERIFRHLEKRARELDKAFGVAIDD